jgi:hypothetical protein
MVLVGRSEAREDSQDGELGLDDQQLGNPVDEEDQPNGAGDEDEPPGTSDEEAQKDDGVQNDQQEKEEAAARISVALLARGHSALI